ncbi:rod shape-determining protein (plasmid) [Mycoplasmatota bacterium]|nr:rod shape-determining protein [Mycoplasmatota bacterium]
MNGYKIGIDLGTKNTLVYINGRGIIFNEPSMVAFDRETNKMIAIGHKANDMLGKEHGKIKVTKPLEGGVIADLNATEVILESIFKKFKDTNVNLKHSTLLLCCPSKMTSSERKALEDLAHKLEIKDVLIEKEVKAGAIGSGIDIFMPKGIMIVDIGGGTTDIGVLSLGDVVVHDSIRIAGNYIDNEIIKYIKYKYGMEIGKQTAEKIKIGIGTLKNELAEDRTYTFSGKNSNTNLPGKMIIKQSEIRNILLKIFTKITNKILDVLRKLPPELAEDILEDGIIINGGGALIDGVIDYFENITNLKFRLSKNPLTSIAEGTKILLQNKGDYRTKPLK